MNKRILAVFAFVLIAAFSGCKKGGTVKTPEYAVIITESDFFIPSVSYATVERGESFSSLLVFEKGYVFDSCNYEGATAEETEDGVLLTIENVCGDRRISVTSRRVPEENEFEAVERTCVYHGNGGRWEDGSDLREQTETLSYHLRLNTLNGEGLSRKGRILTGWNTKADGSGTHIGLGSRTDESELFAEWEKEADGELFTYERLEDGISLTGYRGDGKTETFAIPSAIDGLKVVEIAGSFTTNMPCGRIASKTLVLPDTIRRIGSNAFANAAFDEIVFFDSIESVGENAFGKNAIVYHINAALEPSFQKENDNARFADKIDRLMTTSGKRLVLFGGCATSYGIRSDLLAENFPDFEICNMGVIGGVNADFQFEIMERFLRKDDVLVHMPEEMSGFQLMSRLSLDYRMFIMCEGNYDLLALCDLSYASDFWEAYDAYTDVKKTMPEGSYSDGMMTYNVYGDISVGRPYKEEKAWERDVSLSDGSYTFDLSLLTEEGISGLCKRYDRLKENGVKVLVSWAPVNRDGLGESAGSEKAYEDKYIRLFSERGYAPIGKLSDHIFKGRYFYDSDYHLNDAGALKQTKALISEADGAF